MKILITGHKGFIGQNMVNALQDHDLSFYEWGDDIPEVRGLDWVVHLGAISSTAETNAEKVTEQNYDFSRWLINECQYNKVNFQYASSASVYGLFKNFEEDGPKNPQSPYAWSKYLFDRYVEGFKDKWTVTVQGFRYFNVYGPHEEHKGDQASPYYKFEQQARETGVIKLFEGSDQFYRDFVHVDRIVDVHKTFFDVSESGIWNVGMGYATSFESVARSISEKYNARVEYIPMPAHLDRQYQRYTCADLTKLMKHYTT